MSDELVDALAAADGTDEGGRWVRPMRGRVCKRSGRGRRRIGRRSAGGAARTRRRAAALGWYCLLFVAGGDAAQDLSRRRARVSMRRGVALGASAGARTAWPRPQVEDRPDDAPRVGGRAARRTSAGGPMACPAARTRIQWRCTTSRAVGPPGAEDGADVASRRDAAMRVGPRLHAGRFQGYGAGGWRGGGLARVV
jgi:hypothetical protein